MKIENFFTSSLHNSFGLPNSRPKLAPYTYRRIWTMTPLKRPRFSPAQPESQPF